MVQVFFVKDSDENGATYGPRRAPQSLQVSLEPGNGEQWGGRVRLPSSPLPLLNLTAYLDTARLSSVV